MPEKRSIRASTTTRGGAGAILRSAAGGLMVGRSAISPNEPAPDAAGALPWHREKRVGRPERKRQQDEDDAAVKHEEAPQLGKRVEENEVGKGEVVMEMRGKRPHERGGAEAARDRDREGPGADVLGQLGERGVGGERLVDAGIARHFPAGGDRREVDARGERPLERSARVSEHFGKTGVEETLIPASLVVVHVAGGVINGQHQEDRAAEHSNLREVYADGLFARDKQSDADKEGDDQGKPA